MRTPPVLALINEATLHHAAGNFGTTQASLVATPRYVFIVPHSAQAVPLILNYLPAAQRVGPSADQLGSALQHMLTQPDVTAEQVESWLASSLPPEHVLELAALQTYKVETSSFSRGFYYKDRGELTWTGHTLSANAAARLAAFLPTAERARAASPAAQASAPALEQKPGGRKKGAMLIVTGLALYAAGIASALVIPGVFIIFCAFIAWPPVFSGVYRLVKGELIDPRTGRVAGSWSTRNAIAIMLGVLVGLAMIYPTLELGRVVYQSHHGIVEEDEDVEVPTWDPVEAGHDPKPEEEPPPKKQRRRRTPRRERR